MDVGGEHIESDAPPQCIGRTVLRKRLDKYQQRADGIVAGEQRRKDLPQPQAKDRPKGRAAFLQAGGNVQHGVLMQEFLQLRLLIIGVQLCLQNRGLYPADAQDLPDLLQVEVGQADLLDESGQGLHSGKRGLLVAGPGGNAPDVFGEPGKPGGSRLIDVPVQHGMDHCQARAVVAVGVSAQLVLDLVGLEIRYLADFQHAVLRHSRGPGQLTAGIVVIGILEQHPDVADDAAHDGFVHIVGQVVFIGLAEIGLHGVAQGVEGPGNDLLHGAGPGKHKMPERPTERP